MGLETLPHKVGPNEDVRDLNGGDCDTSNWLIVWCVWVCDKSHIGYLLGWTGRYNTNMASTFKRHKMEVKRLIYLSFLIEMDQTTNEFTIISSN